MRGKLSESTFCFCVSSSIISPFQGAGMQFQVDLPSTVEEAGVGVDFMLLFDNDVIGSSLFLQYKIPRLVRRPRAPNRFIWDKHKKPYYRFELPSNDGFRQHRMLVRLSAEEGGFSFYSAPIVTDRNSFMIEFTTGNVLKVSPFFSAAEMKIDRPFDPGQRHYVSYDPSGEPWYFHSDQESEGMRKSKWADVQEGITNILRDPLRKKRSTSVLNLLRILKDDLHKSDIELEPPPDLTDRQYIKEVDFILQEYYNIDWLLLGQRRQEKNRI